MKYTLIGSLKVSQICLGCMGFGDASQGMHSWTLPYEDSKKILLGLPVENNTIEKIKKYDNDIITKISKNLI